MTTTTAKLLKKLLASDSEVSLKFLKSIEWSDSAVDGTGMAMHLQNEGPVRACCPVCTRFRTDGHTPRCRLAKEIKRRESV